MLRASAPFGVLVPSADGLSTVYAVGYTFTVDGVQMMSTGGTAIAYVGAPQITALPVAPDHGHDYPPNPNDPVAVTGAAMAFVPFAVIGTREAMRACRRRRYDAGR